MRTPPLAPLALVVGCALLTACARTSSGGSDCVSHYEPVASAATWAELKAEMVGSTQRGRAVAALRIQARGDEAVGLGDEQAVRIVDLLGQRGRRIAQVEVWRTDGGGWAAGAWSQCTD